MADAPPNSPSSWPEILQWRKLERARLIEARMALPQEDREARTRRIETGLDAVIGRFDGRLIGCYWPFRAEPDLRGWSDKARQKGARIALPVVIQKGAPLEYRVWSPGDPLERGVWNILVPSKGPVVEPDVVIAPVVGFDGLNYRLGYGGGFFDRTLAKMSRKPFAIGVGYASSEIATIYPQPHDIPMNIVVIDNVG